MAKDVVTNLIARDSMSGPLRKIATEADKVEGALDKTGDTAQQTGSQVQKAGDQGAQSLDKMGDAADRARDRSAALSTALSAMGAGLMYAGKMAMQEEQQIIGLTRAFGDASDEMLAFAETLDDLTMFSDDDIRAGERYFATLRNNYDLSIDQIKELMRVTADLASASGTTYADASSRVTAAIRGEGEAAEYLGLTMNQQSIDRENLTLTMSNQEAAQFRLNALYEQAAVYEGTAGDMAVSNAGKIANMRDTIDDAAASVGNLIGPLGALASGAGSLGFGMAGLATGANVAKVAFSGLRTAAIATNAALGPIGWAAIAVTAGAGLLVSMLRDSDDAMQENAESAEALAQSMATLDTMIKEASLSGDFWLAGTFREWDAQAEEAIANLEARVGNMWTGLDAIINDGNFEEGQSGESFVNWIDATFGEGAIEEALRDADYGWIADKIERGIYDEFSDAELIYMEQVVEKMISGMIPDADDQKMVADAMQPIWELMTNPAVDQSELAANYQKVWDAFDDHGSVEQLIADLEALEQQTIDTVRAAQLVDAPDYYRMMGQAELGDMILKFNLLRSEVDEVNASLSTGELRAYTEAWDGIQEAVEGGSWYAESMNVEIATLTSQLKSGAITNEEYAQSIVDIYLRIPEQEAIQEKLTAGIERTTEATEAWLNSMGIATEEQERLRIATEEFQYTMADTLPLIEAGVESAIDLTASMKAVREEATGLGSIASDAITPTVESIRNMRDILTGMYDVMGQGSLTSQLALTSIESDSIAAAAGASQLAAALDDVFRVVVENTNAIGSQVDSVMTWADELIGVQGELSKLDELVANGRITGESGVFTGDSEYAQAQRAYNDIARENAEIQEHILVIQAKQAPIIRDQVVALEDYMETIANMDPEDALAALGWMDTGMQDRILQVMTLSDQLDDLGPSGEAAFTSMIEGIIATDPAMTQMLIQLGYIEEHVGDNGEITYSVNIDGADGAMSEIEMLNQSIVDLIDVLDDGALNGSYTMTINADTSNAEDGITRTKRERDDFDGSTATGILNADGSNATGTIGVVDESLDALDGQTSTVNVVANDQASSVLATIANNWGGVIATSVIDVITRNVPGSQSGGVVGYAKGGTIVELAEAGPEILHFVGGGTTYVQDRGYYSVPTGTYVTPNNAISDVGGNTFNIEVYGGDAEMIKRVFVDEIIPTMADALNEDRRMAGVR